MYRNALRMLPLVLVAVSVGCSREVDLGEVPAGAEVQVVRDDGALVEGRVVNRTDDALAVDVGDRTPTEIAREDIEHLAVVEPGEPMPPPPPTATFRELTVPAGTDLALEIGTTLDTSTSAVGDPVTALLREPVTIDGTAALPAKAALAGRVTAVEASGRVKGRARLAVAFAEISVGGQVYPLSASFDLVAPSNVSKDAKTIGSPAAGGAVLGAILGGTKGAAVGSAIGGGAGAGAVLLTAGEEIRLGQGAALSVATEAPVTVRVPVEP